MGRYVSYTEEVRALRENDWIDADELKALEDAQYKNHPCYSVYALGKTRFFYVVCPPGNHLLYDGEPLASGYAETREEAERQAREIAAVSDDLPPLPRYEVWGGKHRVFHSISQWDVDLYHRRLGPMVASHYHHKLAVQKRMRKTTQTRESAPLEFVYSFYRSDYSKEVTTNAHRIVKKTKTRIFVEEQSRPWRYKALAESLLRVFVIEIRRVEVDPNAAAFLRHARKRGGGRAAATIMVALQLVPGIKRHDPVLDIGIERIEKKAADFDRRDHHQNLVDSVLVPPRFRARILVFHDLVQPLTSRVQPGHHLEIALVDEFATLSHPYLFPMARMIDVERIGFEFLHLSVDASIQQ